MATKPHVGVILMTYGSPARLDDIPVYLKHVYGGRDASEEVIAEFRPRGCSHGEDRIGRADRIRQVRVDVPLIDDDGGVRG